MSSHKHAWEPLHEILPPVPELDEDGNEQPVPEGEVGHEHAHAYRTEYCGCGIKRTVALSDDETLSLGIRTGRVVADDLTLVARNEGS